LTFAKLLKAHEAALTGTVQLVFQPAEEGGAGGLAMLLAGVSDSTDKVKRMFGMHVWPWLPTGKHSRKVSVRVHLPHSITVTDC